MKYTKMLLFFWLFYKLSTLNVYYALQKAEGRKTKSGRQCPWMETLLRLSVNRDMLLIELFMTDNIGFINCT